MESNASSSCPTYVTTEESHRPRPQLHAVGALLLDSSGETTTAEDKAPVPEDTYREIGVRHMAEKLRGGTCLMVTRRRVYPSVRQPE